MPAMLSSFKLLVLLAATAASSSTVYEPAGYEGALTCGSEFSGTTVGAHNHVDFNVGADDDAYDDDAYDDDAYDDDAYDDDGDGCDDDDGAYAYDCDSADRFYSLEVPATAHHTISLCESAFDTVLILYNGTLGDLLEENNTLNTAHAYNDDSNICGSSRHSEIDIVLDPGIYTVVIQGYNGEEGNYSIRMTCPWTLSPSVSPTTSDPTLSPSVSPSVSPTTSDPTLSPSVLPTTSDPTPSPTDLPVVVVVSFDGDLSTTDMAVQAALIAGINVYWTTALGTDDVSTTLAAGSIVATSIITSPTISNVVLPDTINVVVSDGVTMTATIVRSGASDGDGADQGLDQGSAGAEDDSGDIGIIIGAIAGALVVTLLIVAGAVYFVRNSSGALDRDGAPPSFNNPMYDEDTTLAAAGGGSVDKENPVYDDSVNDNDDEPTMVADGSGSRAKENPVCDGGNDWHTAEDLAAGYMDMDPTAGFGMAGEEEGLSGGVGGLAGDIES